MRLYVALLEHVHLVIHRVADGESSKLCRERVCSGIESSVAWMGCPELLKLWVKV